jgi:hypothetical protein
MAEAESSRLWLAYLEAEREGVKETRETSLERLIAWVEMRPSEERAAWALDFVRQAIDDRAEFPVRFPLFRRLLLPALIDGILEKKPGCARWLSAFQSFLFHSEKEAARLPEGLRNPVDLLREALRVDPADERARRRFIDLRAEYLEYTLHELPSGVLCGADGSTAEECGEQLEELAEFQTEVSKAGRTEEFAELVRKCAYHYKAYQRYLRAGRPGGSYEAFLAENP